MPILPAERTLFPEGLLSESTLPKLSDRTWWVLHVKPRQEKSLARQLCGKEIPYYLPVVTRRTVVRGQALQSLIPLFPGYVFLLGDREEWLRALATGRVVRPLAVVDQTRIWTDLRQLYRLIEIGAPITPEDRLAPGAMVEVTQGPLAGLRGKILRTATGKRFVVEIDFIQRGASVLLDSFALVQVSED